MKRTSATGTKYPILFSPIRAVYLATAHVDYTTFFIRITAYLQLQRHFLRFVADKSTMNFRWRQK